MPQPLPGIRPAHIPSMRLTSSGGARAPRKAGRSRRVEDGGVVLGVEWDVGWGDVGLHVAEEVDERLFVLGERMLVTGDEYGIEAEVAVGPQPLRTLFVGDEHLGA